MYIYTDICLVVKMLVSEFGDITPFLIGPAHNYHVCCHWSLSSVTSWLAGWLAGGLAGLAGFSDSVGFLGAWRLRGR